MQLSGFEPICIKKNYAKSGRYLISKLRRYGRPNNNKNKMALVIELDSS